MLESWAFRPDSLSMFVFITMTGACIFGVADCRPKESLTLVILRQINFELVLKTRRLSRKLVQISDDTKKFTGFLTYKEPFSALPYFWLRISNEETSFISPNF
jgi:hypothetical protein